MKKSIYVPILFSLFLAACGSPEKSSVQQVDLDSISVSQSDQNIIFPSPLQVASIFRKSGLVYIDNIAHETAKLPSYNSQMSKSLNFGIYSADLAYSVLNNQKQKSIDYLNCVKSLSNDLGISSIFHADNLFQSFEKNIGQEDSLIQILSIVQEKLDDHLQSTESEHMGTIYFLGGWIEAMYIGTKVLESSDNIKLTQHLIEQTALLELILRALSVNPYREDALLAASYTQLESIAKIVNSFEFIKGRNIDEIPLEEIELTGSEIEQLSKAVETLRTTIVNS